MFEIDLILTLAAAYFCKTDYDRGRIEWALMWAALLGWDIHTLVAYL